jgi:hypothetical protein
MKVINLLPKSRQQELRYLAVYHVLLRVIIASALSFAAVFAVQFLTKLYLAGEIRTTAAEIQQLKTQVNKDDNQRVKNQINALNGTIADYVNLTAAAPKWSKVIAAFAAIPSPAIKISSMRIDPPSKVINISGFAASRDDVIELYNSILADDKEFYNINYPLENVVYPSNINFHFTFYIKDELLK